GLGDELLLGPLDLRLGGVQLGEEVTPVAVEGRPRPREALPERVLGGPVQTRPRALGLLPLVQEGAQLVTTGTPVGAGRVRGGDGLRALDHGGALLERLGLGSLALRADLLATGRGAFAQDLDAGTQTVEVTDGRRLGQGLG